MPSFVITASVYVDDVTTPEEATKEVDSLMAYIQEVEQMPQVTIVLPDDHNNPEIVSSKWEPVGEGE